MDTYLWVTTWTILFLAGLAFGKWLLSGGIYLRHSSCPQCLYVIAVPDPERCSECGCEFAEQAILPVGTILIRKRMGLLAAWTAILPLPILLCIMLASVLWPKPLPNLTLRTYFDSQSGICTEIEVVVPAHAIDELFHVTYFSDKEQLTAAIRFKFCDQTECRVIVDRPQEKITCTFPSGKVISLDWPLERKDLVRVLQACGLSTDNPMLVRELDNVIHNSLHLMKFPVLPKQITYLYASQTVHSTQIGKTVRVTTKGSRSQRSAAREYNYQNIYYPSILISFSVLWIAGFFFILIRRFRS